jgi:hypothetical protein
MMASLSLNKEIRRITLTKFQRFSDIRYRENKLDDATFAPTSDVRIAAILHYKH